MEKSNISGGKQVIRGKKFIAPSILSADFCELGRSIAILEDLGCEILHLDIMDGHFVPNISFGIPVVKSIRNKTKMILDVHLMIENPELYVEKFIDAGADMISIHQEVGYHKDRLLNRIKDRGKLCGIVLNPATSLCEIENILHFVDFILLMSVNPGFGGQTFIPYVKDKVKNLDEIRREKNFDFLIEIDGGVNEENIPELLSLGVDIFVAGSAVFKGNIKENYLNLKRLIENGRNF